MPKSITPPDAPSHWTDLLPPEQMRLRAIRKAQEKGKRLPVAINPLAGVLQFFWYFAHGLTGAGLGAAGIFLTLAANAMWNPDYLPHGMAGMIVLGVVLGAFGDYLLFKRVDALVDTAGGLSCVTPDQVMAWMRPRHGGWVLGTLVMVTFVGLGAYRTVDVQNIRKEIEIVIGSTAPLQVEIENYRERELKAGRTPSLAGFFQEDGRSMWENDSTTIVPELDKLVLKPKKLSLQGQEIFLKPYFNNDNVIWLCKGDSSMSGQTMPDTCRDIFY